MPSPPRLRIYTRKGDDGTTGLLYGGRVAKSSLRVELNGVVDESQAVLGMARAEADRGSELDEVLVALERELYVLMAEVATAPANRHKLVAGQSLVTQEMVTALEARIDGLDERVTMPTEFVVPGVNRRAAALDVARTVVRRAERILSALGPLERAGVNAEPEDADNSENAGEAGEETSAPGEGVGGPSLVGAYLNRLSDLLWTMARWQEGDTHLIAKDER